MTHVEYITFKDKQYPVRLSYRTFKGLKKDLGKMDIKGLEEFDTELMEAMLWHGLVTGHRVMEQELSLSRGDMEDVLDECMTEFLELVPLFFPKKEGKPNPDLSPQLPEGEQGAQTL